MPEPRSIAIVGGGLMGAGIAQVFIAAGHHVTVFEPSAEARNSIRERVAADLRLLHRPIDHRRWGESSWLNYWQGRDEGLWTVAAGDTGHGTLVCICQCGVGAGGGCAERPANWIV